jgi:hypothetical protein
MILYLEDQLEGCYRHYCLHQIRHDMSFMTLDDYRDMFEDMMTVIYPHEEDE